MSICEGNMAYRGPMITKEESNMLERCFKTGLHIIYQKRFITFKLVLQLADMKSLKYRRLLLLTKFSKRAIRSDKFNNCSCESETRTTGARTRENPIPLLKPFPCRTKRYERSLMTKLLSWHPPLQYPGLDLAWCCYYCRSPDFKKSNRSNKKIWRGSIIR